MSNWPIYYNISYQRSNHDRTCKKLQNLVGDREVWVAHLQGIAEFSKEVVEKLARFGANGSPEMMGEVLKAAASKMASSPRGSQVWEFKVSVQGWGDPVTMTVCGQNLEELISVAQAVGANFIMEEVKYSGPLSDCFSVPWPVYKFLRRIVSLMENQKKRPGFTELEQVVMLTDSVSGHWPLIIALLKVSKRWRIGKLVAQSENTWTRLPTDVVAAGHIDEMFIAQQNMKGDDLGALRKIWKITVKITIHGGGQATTVGGGRGENPDEDWQRMLEIFLPSE